MKFTFKSTLIPAALGACLALGSIGCETAVKTPVVTETTNAVTGQISVVTNIVTTEVANTNLINFAKGLIATNGLVTGIAEDLAEVEGSKWIGAVIQKDPASTNYFKAFSTVLTAALNGGNLTSAQIQQQVNLIPVTGPAAAIIQQGASSFLSSLATAEGSAATQGIASTPYLQPLVATMNNTILLALAQ